MEHWLQRTRYLPVAVLLVILSLGDPMSVARADDTPVAPTGEVADAINAILNPHAVAVSPAPSSASGAPQIGSLTNSASFQPKVAPGSLITLFISNASQLSTAISDSTPLPIGLGGATVTIQKKLVPIVYVSPSQINAQLPYEVPAGNTTATLTVQTMPSNPFSFTVSSAAPGIFTFGTNRAVAQNPGGQLNNVGNAAAVGSVIVVYLTGCGAEDHPVTTGHAAPNSPLSRVTAPYSATIGGQNVAVQFLGLTPGFVGLYQANILIPSGLKAGDHPLVITVGGNASNNPLVTTK